MRDIDKFLDRIWRDLEEAGRRGQIAAIKKSPVAHKLTRLMGDNPANWRWYKAGKDGWGREVRYAWATKRNMAGYFLGWREIVTKDGIKRDQFFAKRVKKKVMAKQLERAQKFRDRPVDTDMDL